MFSRILAVVVMAGLLAVAPAMLLTGLVAGMIGPGPGLVLVQAITGIGFVMIWGAGLAAQVGR